MKSIFLFTLTLLAHSALYAKPVMTVGQACKDITPAIAPFTDSGMFEGSLLLAKGDKVLCHLNQGLDRTPDATLDIANARFPIASLSKPVIATLALRLQELGVLQLNTTIDHYLADFNAPWANKVTLHHLLSNRSGLPGHFALPGWRTGRYKSDLPPGQILDDIANLSLAFEPGSQYLYGNLGWHLLGEIIEQATDTSLADNLRKHVFSPALMTNTGLVYKHTSPLVTGLKWSEEGSWQPQQDLNMQLFNVGAGLFTTPRDLLAYVHALHHGTLLSGESRLRMFDKDAPYGWRMQSLALSDATTRKAQTYDGQLLGHGSVLYRLPEDGVTLVILTRTNMGFAHKDALARDTLKAFYGLPYPDRNALPSLALHKGLLNHHWQEAVRQLNTLTRPSDAAAQLLSDLAQQLEWSGLTEKALDVFAFLAARFPGNQALFEKVNTLCQQHPDHPDCGYDATHVGMALLTLQDTQRKAWRSEQPRPVTTHLFYPTRDTNTRSLQLGPDTAPLFNAGTIVAGGTPVTSKYPLILMSHGTGGSAPQMLWLAEALVRRGYVVAAVNHHGNTAFEKSKYPEGFLLWWERARDLFVAKQALMSDSRWAPMIDDENIAIVGFSLGGYTALSASGAITDKALFDEYCQRAKDDFSCQPQPEFTSVLEAFRQVENAPQVTQSLMRQSDNYRIPGLKATVAIAPAIVHTFTKDSLASLDTPTLFIAGSKDVIAPALPNAVYAHELLPQSQLVTIENGHHYSFLSQCTPLGEKQLAALCGQPHGISRKEVHQRTIDAVTGFLERYL